MKFIKPDFNNNIVNISSTFAKFLNVPNDKPIIIELKKELDKNYKNVIFMICDGMGVSTLKSNNADYFLKNMKREVTSTFPSTTGCALTTLQTALCPDEHNWLGWTMFSKKVGKVVTVFMGTDYYNDELVEVDHIKKMHPIEQFYNKSKNDKYKISSIFPKKIDYGKTNRNYVYENNIEMFSNLKEICKNNDYNFIVNYNLEPDLSEHIFGVNNDKIKSIITDLENGVDKLLKECPDTLVVITADHGQINIADELHFYEDEKLRSYLSRPFSLDGRSVAIFLKENTEEDFVKYFNKQYGRYYKLFKSDDLILDGYFGNKKDLELKEYLGDYIAVGKSNMYAKFKSTDYVFKGAHSSLCEEEMKVPLIILSNKQ